MTVSAEHHAQQARQTHSYIVQARAALSEVRTGPLSVDELRALSKAVAALGEAEEHAAQHLEALDLAAEGHAKAVAAQQAKAKADADAKAKTDGKR